MVPDRWYIVLESRELPSGRPVGATRLGEAMVFWRDASGAVHATSDRCAHRGASLALGKVVDGCVECPFHGFRFDGSGACTKIPANGTRRAPPAAMRVRAWPVREEHGFVWLWWGEAREELPPVPWFAEIDDRFVWDGFADDWNTHYTRAVENQLDFTHLPFVHQNTIGASVPEALDVVTEIDGDRIRASYDPASYDAKGFYVELIAPSLWRNQLTDGVFVVAAFVPVDEGRTRLYLRLYQRHFTVPGLGWAACWAANLFNRYVLWQDKRVVLTQEPRVVGDGEHDVLVASDAPIAAWRRWQKQNGPSGGARIRVVGE